MSARFGRGDPVRVRRAFPPGHVRTPFYTRGKTGEVIELAGHYRDPEELAYGRTGEPERPLYRVRFTQAELWGAAQAHGDELVVDLFEHWLEPADG
ncbi:MAG: SH3-like domain-containing protein [Alphaproteobacteria bacterium]